MNLNILLKEIESCRQEMILLASERSLSDQKVLEVSKRLDCLLNLYYKYPQTKVNAL